MYLHIFTCLLNNKLNIIYLKSTVRSHGIPSFP